MTDIAIAILNWNGLDHLKQFLPSVVSHSPEANIFVIDNGSTDESLNFLQLNHPDVIIIRLNDNHGYCGGYNRGIEQIKQKYTVLLNSDVEVSENWLAPLIEAFSIDAKLAAVQPKILAYSNPDQFEYAGACGGFVDKWGYPFTRGRIFDSCEKDKGQYDNSIDVLWASGACIMIKTSTFKKAGGLDESFFAHMEEIDLCWRLKNMGFQIRCIPKSVVYHLGGGTLPYASPRKTYLNFRNGLALIVKNQFKGFLFLNILIRLTFDGVAGIKFLLEGNPNHTLSVIKAHFSFYSRLKLYLIKRKANRRALIDNRNHLYSKSIVVEHFIKRNKRYSDLDH